MPLTTLSWGAVLGAACACLAGVVLAGCGLSRQIVAAPDDLADYRSYRTAAREGARLARAQRYLARHPAGVWAEEVRMAFDAEEPTWFEAAKSSRTRARDYLVDLPDGPHAAAALALVVLFDEHQGDIDTLELVAASRRTAATLDLESSRRKHLGDLILGETAALLDPATWGARLDDPPRVLASVLRGPAPRTWGGGVHARRDDAVFFVLPTPRGAEERVATVRFQLWLDHGRASEGLVEGEDLFVRWAEAMQIHVLDASNPVDRAAAAAAVSEVLDGALEATLPASRCAPGAALSGQEVLVRACDGWRVVARMGAAQGDEDAIDVRGPRYTEAVGESPPPLKLDGAQSQGMR